MRPVAEGFVLRKPAAADEYREFGALWNFVREVPFVFDQPRHNFLSVISVPRQTAPRVVFADRNKRPARRLSQTFNHGARQETRTNRRTKLHFLSPRRAPASASTAFNAPA